MHKVFLGIGSNIGNRLSHLQEAVDRLSLLPNTSVYKVSSIYMTEPVGETEQNRFYNGVILLRPHFNRKSFADIAKLLSRSWDGPTPILDGVQESLTSIFSSSLIFLLLY